MQLVVRYEQLDPGPVVRDMFAWDGIAIVDYGADAGIAVLVGLSGSALGLLRYGSAIALASDVTAWEVLKTSRSAS
jgi:hypothetical protein